MKSLKFNLIIMLFIAIASQAEAQKFGHLNSGNILVQLPETFVADSLLKIYQDSLVVIGSVRADSLEAEYMAFAKEYQAGNVPPIKAQQKQDEFRKRQEELAQYEDAVIELVAKKREKLIGPILQNLQVAINEVGKEGGYTMIFDTSTFNTILFAQEGDDLEPLIKAKLGIK